MRIPTSVPADAQQAFRDLYAIVAPLDQTRAIDWKSRRLTQLGEATDAADAATKAYVDGLIAAVRADAGLNTTTGSVGALNLATGRVRLGPFASRGAATAHAGDLFVASDRNYVVWVSDGATWKYVTGFESGTLSPDAKPTLTADDIGYVFYATDFSRAYRWSGSAWADAQASDRGSIVFFDANPGTGWHLADGSTNVTKSTSTGGTTTVTVPDATTGHRFLRSVGSSPGGTGGSATTHTHAIDPPSTTTNGPTPSTTDADGGSGATVQSGTGATVAAHPHTHDFSHTHDLDVASFTSGAPSGTSGDDALPPYLNELPYYRL